MKCRIWLTMLLLVFICLVSTACAEQVAEVWRYPWGGTGDIAASAHDGSVWVTNTDSGSVLRFAPGLGGDLQEVVRVYGFPGLGPIAASSADGSCWVGDQILHVVVHLAADGTELSRTGGIRAPTGLSVDPTDGACWAADEWDSAIVHLDSDGTVASRTPSQSLTGAIAAVPGTNSCWFAESNLVQEIHRLQENPDGSTTLVATGTGFGIARAISRDSTDATIWVSDCNGGAVRHLRENPDHTVTLVHPATSLSAPQSLSAVPGAGVWVVEECGGGSSGQGHVMHLDAAGVADVTLTEMNRPYVVSVDVSNGSCWVLDAGELVHLTAAGQGLQEKLLLREPITIAANPLDGSSWVVDPMGERVVHITAGGEVIPSSVAFSRPICLAVDPVDGTVWVGDASGDILAASEVIHLAADGGELSRTGGFCCPRSLAVDPNDHSCWVADAGFGHLSMTQLAAADGAPALTAPFPYPTAVAVDPNDSSIWVGTRQGVVLPPPPPVAAAVAPPPPGGPAILHFAWTEGELLPVSSVEVSGPPVSLAVDPVDSSCLAVLGAEPMVAAAALSGDLAPLDGVFRVPVYRVSETPDGPVVASLGRFISPTSVSVNPRDRSIWVGDQFQVGRMSADGTLLSRSGEFTGVRSVSVDANTGSCWVASSGFGPLLAISGLGNLPVPGFGLGAGTVAQLAVVPEAGFTASVTNGAAPLAVSFTDLSTGYPTSWQWDFGDGGASADQNPTHSYAAGLYTVSLAIQGLGGSDTETKTNYIHAAIALAAAFSSDVTRGASPLAVQFTDESTAGAASWLWSFGDGVTSADRNPTHTYEDPGFYTVTLTVEGDGVSASATKSACIAVGFADTPADHWAFMQEIACAEAGIAQGYWDGTYRPNETVNRAQMATYIARALAGGDENVPSGPNTPTFTDVAEDHWAYRYIEHCAGQDIVTGYGGGTYRPDEVVNRGQMAVFIARMVAIPTGLEGYVPGTTPIFPDVTSANEWAWCYQYVQYLGALDPPIVAGYPDGNYKPANNVTRDQMAVYMQRALDLPIPGPTE